MRKFRVNVHAQLWVECPMCRSNITVSPVCNEKTYEKMTNPEYQASRDPVKSINDYMECHICDSILIFDFFNF